MNERPDSAGARWPAVITAGLALVTLALVAVAVVAFLRINALEGDIDQLRAEAVQAAATPTPLAGEAEALALLDVAPPQYEGMTKAEEENYREFASEVRRVDEGMDADNIIVSARNVAIVLSEDYGEYGGADTLATWQQLQTDDGWEELQSPAYWEYIGTHLDELRLFAPWVADARREKALLGIEVTTFEEPTRAPRPTRPARPTREPRATRQDVQEQEAIRDWLAAEDGP